MSKYARVIETEAGNLIVDVYDVLRAFDVTCPAVQHAVKKLLMAGARGGKSTLQDLREARESLDRAIELEKLRAKHEHGMPMPAPPMPPQVPAVPGGLKSPYE